MTLTIDQPVRPSNRFGPFPAPEHPCSLCGKTCPGRRSRCMSCTTRIRRYRLKAAAVALLGGVATCCGWKGHLAGYAFHHSDDNKEFEIADLKNKSWSALRGEILKCKLWCCRCHAIHHSGYSDQKFMEAVNDYHGDVMTL